MTYYQGPKGEEKSDYSNNFRANGVAIKNTTFFYYGTPGNVKNAFSAKESDNKLVESKPILFYFYVEFHIAKLQIRC